MYSLIRALAVGSLLIGSSAFAQSVLPKPPHPVPPIPVPAFPEVESEPLSADAVCVNAEGDESPLLHFAKISFIIDKGYLNPRDNRDRDALARLPRGVKLSLNVRDNPRRIHNLLGKVLLFLRARDDDFRNRSLVEILDVDYAVACAEPADEPVPNPPHPPKPPKH